MIQLRVLGPVDLRGPDGRAIQSVIAQEKRLALLTYLAVSRPGEMCRRDRLLGVFWPESDEGRARNALSQAIFHLRKSLGEETIVGRGAEELGIDPEHLWCDVTAFGEAIETGDLARAVELYRGPLLDGIGAVSDAPEWEHWLDTERTRLERMHADVIRAMARGREEAGDFTGAVVLWKRVAELLPYDTEVALRVMQAHAESGGRAEALLHARAFQDRLRADLDADPDPEVDALADRMRAPGSAAPQPAPTRASAAYSLPASATPLIGRAAEVKEIRRTLLRADVRLLTLTGPGGVGKTRLGIEVARAFHSDLSYEVAFAELASVTDPARVLPAVASAVGVREEGPLPLVDKLREHLRTRRILLLLDNFEHVLAAAPEVAALLDAAPRLKLLATSRAALRVAAEHELPVSPLAVPDPALSAPTDELLRLGAVELFVARARAVKPDFELTAGNAGAVAEICARLDGLPLAIELAAARTRVLAPPSLVARLRQRLKLLTGGPADRPARQQTLRGAIEWSYDLLGDAERELFRRLSVFRGGCSLEAVDAVCGSSAEACPDPLDLLESLIAKSLVERVDAGETSRYRMLDTLGEYAGERLHEDRFEAEATMARHSDFYLRLAEAAEPGMVGSEQASWLSRLAEEHANLRVVLERARERGDAETMLRIAGALWRFWWMHGHLTEGRRWTGEALRLAVEGGTSARWRGKALLAGSTLALYQGELATAREMAEQALAVFEDIGDRAGIAGALSRLGQEAWKQGDHDAARRHYERSLELQRAAGQPGAVARLLFSLGSLEIDLGRFDEARRLYAECLALNERTGDRELAALVLLNLGMVAYRAGELYDARARLEEGIEIARSVGSKLHLAGALNTLGTVARDVGDLETARTRLRESYALQKELGDRLGLAHSAHSLGALELRAGLPAAAAAMLHESLRGFQQLGIRPPAECLADFGELALSLGSGARAVRLLAAASMLAEHAGSGMTATDRSHLDRVVARAREAVGEELWEREWAAGSEMTTEDATRLALAQDREGDQGGVPSV